MGGLRKALSRGIWSVVFMVTPAAGERGKARCSEGHRPVGLENVPDSGSGSTVMPQKLLISEIAKEVAKIAKKD
jgi:hypothetical protein